MTLWSRHGTNFTDRLPKIAEAVCSLAAESALIDGEAVVFRPDGCATRAQIADVRRRERSVGRLLRARSDGPPRCSNSVN